MQALSSHGDYKLSLVVFFDKSSIDPIVGYDPATVFIYRRRDNKLVGNPIYLSEESETSLSKDSPNCYNLYPLELLTITYSNYVYLSENIYNDPQGYYIIWERCCRNKDIINIQKPNQTGMVFRLDFPSLVYKGSFLKNSSPDFTFPPIDYVCINKAFHTFFNAQDADGDQLKYELVDPLAGYTSEFPESNKVGTGQAHTFYPSVTWNQNFNATNAISGNPPLQINPNTGELTLTANKLGLFTFTVLVHEFRNNIEIGQVRRDFQLPVVDCNQNSIIPIPPIITLNGEAETTVRYCDSTSLTLNIQNDLDYQYQWQRDGVDIYGETNSSIAVSKIGVYTVTKKFFRNCGRDTISQPVNLFCQTQLYIPNVFTPNGDGINDNWVISTLENLDDLEVYVFDRWGNVVYYSRGYRQPWDGTYHNKKLLPEEYVYRINSPQKPSLWGSVLIIY